EHLLELAERGSAARGEDELRRLVGHDAGVAAGVEDLALGRVAIEVLGAAAPHAQRAPARRGLADAFLERFEAQNRGSSGCGSAPPRTCMAPYSAQRTSVGTALP